MSSLLPSTHPRGLCSKLGRREWLKERGTYLLGLILQQRIQIMLNGLFRHELLHRQSGFTHNTCVVISLSEASAIADLNSISAAKIKALANLTVFRLPARFATGSAPANNAGARDKPKHRARCYPAAKAPDQPDWRRAIWYQSGYKPAKAGQHNRAATCATC